MIYIYGSPLCSACQARRAELEAAGIEYELREARRLTGKWEGELDAVDAAALAEAAWCDWELPVVVEV